MRRNAARAEGRCVGALIFSTFGGVWLLLSLAYFGALRAPISIAVLGVVLVFAGIAWTQMRRAKPLAANAYPEEERSRNDRAFFIVNGVTYGLVFLLFTLLPPLGLSNYVFPGFVALVGLHFFPMPPLYRHRANLVTGGFMVIWSVFCAVYFSNDRHRIVGFVTLGAGLALWASSVWALLTAQRLLSESEMHVKAVDPP